MLFWLEWCLYLFTFLAYITQLIYLNFMSGKPVNKCFDTSLFRWPICMCASLLCQIQGSSFLANRQAIESKEVFSKSTMYMFWILFPTNISSFMDAWQIKQWLASKVTFRFLSHNWLILSKLCLSPSTSKTSSISTTDEDLIFPVPIILPLLLSPYMTCPLTLWEILLNFLLSPVMCLEQPLSRYHIDCLASACSWKTCYFDEAGTQVNLGPLVLDCFATPLGTYLNLPLGTLLFLK